MPTTGFHSEWVTIDRHRILLECRASFPEQKMRLIASVAAATCDSHAESKLARVVQVFYDDHSSMYHVKIASTDPEDRKIGDEVRDALQTIFNNGNCVADVVIVKPGNASSDSYDHMAHLSVGADVAVDRWRYKDEDYQKKVRPPT